MRLLHLMSRKRSIRQIASKVARRSARTLSVDIPWGRSLDLDSSTRSILARWSHSRLPLESSKSSDFSEWQEVNEDRENGNSDGDLASNPWKNLLVAPARATWRVTDPNLPESLFESIQKIIDEGQRTPKQLKRAHRKVLSIHDDLAEFRERERRRLVNGKQYRSKSSQDDSTTRPVYYGLDESLATLKHRLLPNYAITKRILEETKSLLGQKGWEPLRILDFGIGCGSSSLAALDTFKSIDWIHGIEPSKAMRDCSQSLIEGMTADQDSPPRVTFSTSMPTDSAGNAASFDLAFCAYTATDLPDIMSTLAGTAITFEKLKPGGVFIMIEPGTPDGFNSIRSVRNMLLDCCPPDDPEMEWAERCHIIAPCTHNGSCPMERHKKDFLKRGKQARDISQDLEDNESVIGSNNFDTEDDDTVENPFATETEVFNASFCSFVQTMPTSDNGEKFSYLVAQKRIYGATDDIILDDPFKDDKVKSLLVQAHDAASRKDIDAALDVFKKSQSLEKRYLESDTDNLGLELLRGDEKRSQMGRIIRAPIKKKGHIYIDYCASPGKIIRSRVTKATSNNLAPGLYSAARKSRWGGLWPDTS